MEPLDASLLHTDTAIDSIDGDINWFTKPGIDNTNEYVDLITSLPDTVIYTPYWHFPDSGLFFVLCS